VTAVCLIDTSIFVEVLNVPGKAQKHEAVLDALGERIATGETLFLPMAAVLETGNHIGQNGDGRARRACAAHFVEQVTLALAGGSPFKPINFLTQNEMRAWLAEFEDHATNGSGLGDLSIIHDWRRLCDQNPARRVYIWSFDEHLSAYNRSAEL